LKRATIVEKWWRNKIKKATRQSEKLWKGSRTRRSRGNTDGRVVQKMRRQERLASQRLSEREVQRERSPQDVGQEGEGVDVREEEADMNLEEEREDSAPIIGEIGNSD
jgi:hypothetical protein